MRTTVSEIDKIEQELLDVTSFVPEKRYRKRQDYLAALLRSTCDLPDAEFNKLSDDAADWAYKASDAYQAQEPLPDFRPGNGADHDAVVGNPIQTEIEESDGDEKTVFVAEAEPEVAEKPKAKRGRKPKAKDETKTEGTKVKAKAKDKDKTIKTRAPRQPRPKGDLNQWGVLQGTVSEVVCQLMSKDEGTTMREIRDVTGHYRYNVVNRLQRLGWHIIKDGSNLKMRGRISDLDQAQVEEQEAE